MKNSTTLRVGVATVALVAALSCHADGAVMFSIAGDDLQVTFSAPLSFTVTAEDNFVEYGIVFKGAYSTPQPRNLGITAGDAAMTLNTSPSSTVGGFGGTIASAVGVSDPNDFALTWEFGSPQLLAIGDEVYISSGIRTLPGFISNGGILPDTMASSLEVVLFGDNALPRSAPVQVAIVPEPTSMALLTFGVGLLLVRFSSRSSSNQAVQTTGFRRCSLIRNLET